MTLILPWNESLHQTRYGTFDAETAYRQASDAAAKQAKTNNAGLDRGNKLTGEARDAALANRDAISQLAAAWNNQSAAVQNNNTKFQAARDAFIQTARDMGVPKKAAEALARQLLDIPRQKVIEVIAKTGDAKAELQHIIDLAASIHDKTVRLNYIVTQTNAANAHHAPEDSRPDTPAPKPTPRRPAFGGPFSGRVRVGSGAVDPEGGIFTAQQQLTQFQNALAKSSDALDRERGKRDRLIGLRDRLADSIRSGLTRDPFADVESTTGGTLAQNPFSAGAGSGAATDGTTTAPATPASTLKALRQETSDSRRFIAAIKTLKSRGVKGPVLASLISSGDLARAELYASLPADDLNAYVKAYNTSQNALKAAGLAGGNAEYGAQIAAQVKATMAQAAEVRAQTKAVHDQALVVHRIEAVLLRLEKQGKGKDKPHKTPHRRHRGDQELAEAIAGAVGGAMRSGMMRGAA